MTRTVLYGISRIGEVQLTQLLEGGDQRLLRSVAEAHLTHFDRMEVWVESVCVVKLRRWAA